MLAFVTAADSMTRYQRTGFALLLASFWIFTQSLPPFQSGIWVQVETVVAALWLCGGMVALWVVFGLATLRVRLLPPSLPEAALLGWLAWQLVAGGYAVNGLRSWFGPPEQGEGAAWHVALTVLTLAMAMFWEHARWRKALILSAAAAITVQCLLYLAFPLTAGGRYVPGSWRPSTWAAYLAFMAGYVWLAWVLAAPRRKGQLLAGAALMALVLVLSGNKSAMLLLGLSLLVTLVSPVSAPHAAGSRRIGGLLCVAPLMWVVFSVAFPVIEPYSNRVVPMLSEKDGSLGSRIMLNRMAAEAMRHEPKRWLAGAGWGGFPDVTFRYALLPDVYVFKDGIRQPNNLMVDGYSFHSHNQPLEALLALGLPGLLLWLALPLALLCALPPAVFWLAAPMLVGLVWEASMWFELAQCVPFHALALSGLMAGAKRNLPGVNARTASVAFAAFGIALLASAHWQYQSIDYAMRLRNAAHALPAADYPQGWVESDLRLGGDRLRSSAEFFTQWLILKQKGLGLDDNDRSWFGRFVEAAHSASQTQKVGAIVAALEPKLCYVALKDINDSVFSPMHALLADNLPAVLLLVARRVPERDDIAAPYLSQIEHSDGMPHEQRMAFVGKLLEIAPHHRGALWVKGALLRQLPGQQEQGISLQQQSLAMGVARVYPLSPLAGQLP